eukprot:363353-Chlamydomonas_euryale.AAC.4
MSRVSLTPAASRAPPRAARTWPLPPPPVTTDMAAPAAAAPRVAAQRALARCSAVQASASTGCTAVSQSSAVPLSAAAGAAGAATGTPWCSTVPARSIRLGPRALHLCAAPVPSGAWVMREQCMRLSRCMVARLAVTGDAQEYDAAAEADAAAAGMHDEHEAGQPAASSSGDGPCGLPLPSVRYMRPLDSKTKKALRSRANSMASGGSIPRIICGAKGITQPFINSAADMLGRHELVRVKLGEGMGMERGEARAALESLLDAVSVYEIGFTITLHRTQGLPRPSNCPAAGTVSGLGNSTVEVADVEVEPSSVSVESGRGQKKRISAASATRAAAEKEAAKARPKPPPDRPAATSQPWHAQTAGGQSICICSAAVAYCVCERRVVRRTGAVLRQLWQTSSALHG